MDLLWEEALDRRDTACLHLQCKQNTEVQVQLFHQQQHAIWFTYKMSLKKTTKRHKKGYKEMQNDYQEIQNNQKETETNYKDT